MPLLGGCSPLGVVNALIPAPGGTAKIAADVAYSDHPRQRFDVYAPEGHDAATPLLMFIYGGSWSEGEKAHYAFIGRIFAAAGYLTAIPDYRVVPDVHYPDFVIDCGRALAAFRAKAGTFGGRPGPVHLVGHSAGAYNAVMLGLAEDLAQAAGLDRRHIAAIAGLSGPYDFLPLRVSSTKQAFGSAPDLEATQPINRVRPDAPPMLLVNGSDDEVVVPRNIYRLQELLAAEGVTAVTREYEGVGHAGTLLGLTRSFGWQGDVLADVVAFFASVRAGADRLASRTRRSQMS